MKNIFFQFDRYLYVFLTCSFMLVGTSYAIIIWCNWKLYKHIKEYYKRTVIRSFVIELQTQMTRTFIVQAIIPLITCGVPILFMTIVLLLSIDAPEYFSATLGIFLAYVPLVNGLSMLFYVHIYRNYVKNLVMTLVKCIS